MTLVQTELKKLYLWTTPIKKVYKGSTQIRPTWGSLAFDRTTMSALPSWWTCVFGPYSFDSGLKVTDSSAAFVYPLDMSSVKTLTITCNWNRTGTTSWWIWWDMFGITNKNGFVNSNDHFVYKQLVHMKAYWANANYNNQANGIKYFWYSTWNSQQHLTVASYTGTTGNWNTRTIIDFNTWLIRISSSGPVPYSQQCTLSSALLAEIKTYTYIVILMQPTASSNNKLYNTSIIRE